MSKAFDRVIIVMFENQYRNYVMQNEFMQKLASAGANMTNYFGAFHPSQTNYVASLAGEVCAITNDTPPARPLMQQTLVDVLEPAGVSWKAYMEGYPGDPWKAVWENPDYSSDDQPLNDFPTEPPLLARYFRKHNAFASFHTIQRDESRWNRIVGENQFWDDVSGKALPEYSWFTPDIWNDGHYLYNTHLDTNPRTQLVPQIATWLEYVFLPSTTATKVQDTNAGGQDVIGLGIDVDLLLSDPAEAWKRAGIPEKTLVVITFDEADYDAVGYDTAYDGPNQVYTVLLGDMIEPGTIVDQPFNHYSLMKTIEQNFETESLQKNDRDANWFRFLWNESFSWSAPQETAFSAAGAMAVAEIEGGAGMVLNTGDDFLMFSSCDGQSWSDPAPLPFTASDKIAVATLKGQMHLVFADGGDCLLTAVRSEDGTWSDASPLGQKTGGSIAMTSYFDDADGQNKMMLCWQSENGFIRYRIHADGCWAESSCDVGQLTDGPMTLAQMGPSLFLVYKERNTRKMRITSFNLAPFNAFEAQTFDDKPACANDTSIHQWSPADWHVGSFARKMAALQNDYQADGRLAMATLDGEMHLFHRGAYADTPSAYTEIFGLTGVFTAAHQETNGYGTLDQAGWTKEQELDWINLDRTSGIAVANVGDRLLLAWQPSKKSGGKVNWSVGGY